MLSLTPLEIKIKLLRLGITQSQIAKDLGVSRAAVSQTINQRYKSERISSYLSNILENKKAA